MNIAADFGSWTRRLANFNVIEAMWEPVRFGPFTVKAHPVDHSAFDALAFEIEADGKKIFYTGDIRAHGRTSKKT